MNQQDTFADAFELALQLAKAVATSMRDYEIVDRSEVEPILRELIEATSGLPPGRLELKAHVEDICRIDSSAKQYRLCDLKTRKSVGSVEIWRDGVASDNYDLADYGLVWITTEELRNPQPTAKAS